MTNTGKCDTCRTRKVKCDEQKPKCTACRKRDRPCTYSFGKVSAFVAEDPTQLSKHGKARIAPVVYPLVEYDGTSPSSSDSAKTTPSPSSSSLSLRTTSERDADAGQGVFMTLTVASQAKPKGIRKPTAQQRKKLESYLIQLRSALSTPPTRLSSPESALAARYLHVLGGRPIELEPLALLGNWIQSIPSRLGSSPVVDLAVEYFADSFDVYRHGSFSSRNTALASKAKALKELQLDIRNNVSRPTYDTILAMKLHFAAEIFMGIKNLYHAIHAAGLADILKQGPVSGMDEEHFWSFLDNTYIDDVIEALVAGRTSVFDTEFYLEMSSSGAIPADATPSFQASAAIMHSFIQMPRLTCLVRHVINNPEDMPTLAIAVSLAESLWMLDPLDLIEDVLKISTSTTQAAPSPEIEDIVADSFHFDSVQNCILLSRYWMLMICLCGLTESLHAHFPAQAASSLLPNLAAVRKRDVDAAIDLARCVRYSIDVCPALPLLPLRIHTTFQLSIGSWYRLIQRLTRAQESPDVTPESERGTNLAKELRRAQRMEDWVTNECNRIHGTWNVNHVSKKFLQAAVEDMSGGPIPEWLPTRVRFESEGGKMVMKLEYDIPGPRFAELLGYEKLLAWTRRTTTPSPFTPKKWVQVNPGPTGIMTRLPYNRGY